MNKVLMYVAYGLGGFVILSGAFFGFAVLSGTPLSQIPGLQSLFPVPPEGQLAPPDGRMPSDVNAREELAADQRSAGQVFERARSPLQAFLLPSPFSAGELEALADDLERQQATLKERERELELERSRLEEEKQHYRDLFAELEELRSALVRQNEEQQARSEELQRNRDALAEVERASFRSLAAVYAEGKAKDMAAMLARAYPPEKAALILAALPEDRAAALLTEIHKADPDLGARSVDAFRQAQSKPRAEK